MLKKYLLILSLFLSLSLFAQTNNWQLKSERELTSLSKIEKRSSIQSYQIYTINFDALKNQLSNARKRGVQSESNLTISFPNSKGELDDFQIFEAPVLHPDLGSSFPDIKSYVGISLKNKSTFIRFSSTLFGFHGMILSSEGTTMIEPYTTDFQNYIVYAKNQAQTTEPFECLVNEVSQNVLNPVNENKFFANSGVFRTYRLALACTVEYAAFHINQAGLNSGTLTQRQNAILSAMTVTMTRVNGIFERDLSITTQIIPGNLPILFLLPENPDNLTNNSGGALINEIQPIVDNGVGAANYDIGHVFSTGGGGIAQLFSPCSANKARGVTGSGAPVGDPFDVDYVAHEMGHQFGANHTQNNSCQRSPTTSVEPGSASTIMGYAGICPPNVQNNSDAHFHAVSMAEMDAFISGSGNCAASVTNNNNAPVITPIKNYSTPISTPFILDANATDVNGDVLTYCWEQTNNQVSTQPPAATSASGPNFRSISPTTTSSRYFPALSTVLSGATANTWEVIPSVGRTMNFALTVRDNRVPLGGQTARANMTVTTVAASGPFLVSSPNTNVSWQRGSNQTITWDVAGTTANGVDCEFVDIYLSSNGGTSFPTLLASKVPNDGSQVVTMPNATGNNRRIMVKGNDHIFYDVSNTNFTVATSPATFALSYDGTIDGQNKPICQGDDAVYEIRYEAIGGFNGNTTFSVSGNPAATVATFSPSNISSTGTIIMTLSNTSSLTPGLYNFTVTGTSGSITKTVDLYFQIRNSAFSSIVLTNPLNEASGQNIDLNLEWNPDPIATAYAIEVATDIDFTTLIVNTDTTLTSFSLNGLASNTNYFWRVKPKNDSCEGEFSSINRFTTGNTVCFNPSYSGAPITISASGTPTVNSTITIPSSNNILISDVSVTLNILHTWISDLTVTLISPLGTEVILFSNQCTNLDNANATFSANGTTLTCSTTSLNTISGNLLPQQSFSAFNGQSSQGTWTLRVSDAFNQDGGSINSWSLNICNINNQPLTCGQITTTWNGTSWTNGYPVSNVAASINGDFTSNRDLVACSLNIIGNSNVTITSGDNFIIGNAVNVASTSTLSIQNNANLIQIEDSLNTGNATVARETNPLKRLDYVLWSNPLLSSQTLKNFSPETLNNRFYFYNTQTNVYNTISNPLTTTFQPANGYLIRMPNNHPTTPTIWTGQFSSGIPNNGNYEVNLAYFGASQNFNLIGNPYPSTINADTFLINNASDIDGVIYLFREENNAVGTGYATYTLGGATTTTATSPVPNGTIQVGQGFVVSTKDVPNPKASFNNDMRVKNNNNQFFRTSFGKSVYQPLAIEKHRIWLNLTSDDGFFSQMMVGYFTNATLGFDNLIDGKSINDSPTYLSSIINNVEYTIQGRPLPFDNQDIVPLKFKTISSGNFTISINNVDGLFIGNQKVYLKDNLLNVIHDIKNAPYSFTSLVGEFDTRFEIVYQNTNLNNPSFDLNNQVLVSTENEQINIRSSNLLIQEITIYDILGRKLYNSNSIESKSFFVTNILKTKQTLIVKVVLINGISEVIKIHY